VRDAIPSALVVELIEQHRALLGIPPGKISGDEIMQRLVYALTNEGAKILEGGIASKASQIDMVYFSGNGFPHYRGGPMCSGEQLGLSSVMQAMKRFAANPLCDAGIWLPASLPAEGSTFT